MLVYNRKIKNTNINVKETKKVHNKRKGYVYENQFTVQNRERTAL